VIDQDGFKPRAQGLFWDLRGAVPQLMRRDAPGITSLNADAIRAATGPTYQDQEPLNGIQYCVHMPAEHQLCIVLLPNLISIGGAGMPQHHAHVTRMETCCILSVHASMPFIPCVILPQGSIGKIHEPDKRHCITDAGAPRAPLTSSMGTEIVPINISVLTPRADSSSSMQAERKPRFSHVRNDSKILNSAAKALEANGEPPEVCRVYAACDEFKAFFHQCCLHTSELSSFLLTLLRDGLIHVASERVLGFGCAPSSGIAQRFAHLVREVVTARMLVADTEAMAELRARAGPHMRAWFARRDALTALTGRPQALLFAISIYTDDSAQNAVGCVRMVVFVITWTDTCDDLGIICADPHKRGGLVTFILCLGIVLCHTFRGAFVPVTKVLRASADIVIVFSHEPSTFSTARSVFCLLCHISDALCLSPSLSYGLFNQYKEGGLEPNEPLVLNDRTRAACERWLVRLRSKVCGAFSPSAQGEQARYLCPTQVSVYTDASEEGLCGFCHGHYFRVDLTPEWAVLPMPVLEFVAFYCCVLAFHQLIRGFKVSLFTDSSVVASIAENGRARSELMELVHTALLCWWRGGM
jgi:hypothetical protein